jgi:hypothetical protein
MILDIVGDLVTYRRQLKHLVFDERIVGLRGRRQLQWNESVAN